MTKPRQDRTDALLKEHLRKYRGAELFRIYALNLLRTASVLADQDLEECHTNEQKQKVWAALIGVVHAVVTGKGAAGKSTKALFDAMRDTGLGIPGDHGFEATKVSSRKPFEVDWCRAATIAFLEKRPDRRDEVLAESAKILGLTKKQVAKFYDNFRNAGLGGVVMKRLVETAKNLIDETEAKSLKELTQSGS